MTSNGRTLDCNEDRCTGRERDELRLALNGDEEALGSLIASHMPQLYRAALRFLGTPQDAEEALQDGLVQAVRHFREFEGRSRFSTWLTRIVINDALMRLRRRRRDATTSIDQKLGRDDLCLAESIADPRPNPEEMYAQEEWLRILRRKLQSLPAAYGSALWLCDVQGMSTREAAEALGIPVGSLKSNLHRARLSLRAEVGGARGTHKTLRAARSRTATTGRRVYAEQMEAVAKPAA
jgi:RNA polymerase sigma-70 factor (ECF subfamily)